MPAKRAEHIRTYFDSDASQYLSVRYPDQPKTCDQLSYLTRRRYTLEMLDRNCPNAGGILDIGCGPGVFTQALLDRGWTVWSIDLSERMAEEAQRSVSSHPRSGHAHFAVGSATSLPFEPQSFDAVLGIGVLSYVDDIQHTLAECSRILKPHGSAILQISNKLSPFECEARLRGVLGQLRRAKPSDAEDNLYAHVRLTPYRPSVFHGLCRAAGFRRRDWRYYDFRPPILTPLLPGASFSIANQLQKLNSSPFFGWLGAGYLVGLERTT